MPHSTKSTRPREGAPLTPRELELLAVIARGLSTREIVEQLGITPGTVKAHLTSIFRKIGVANRVQAARYYIDNLRPDPAATIELRPGAPVGRDDDTTIGHAPHRAPRPRSRLSRRELQVLEQIGAGETSETIARELGLTEGTIKAHLTSIYRKTGSQNRVQAARYYLRHYASADAAQLSTLDDDIADVKARLHELQPAVEEAQRLRQALEALQAVRGAFKR